MMKRFSKTVYILILIFYPLLFKSSVFALDPELRSLPQLPNSQIVWQDKTLQVNGIVAPAMHLRSSLPVNEIINFYKDALAKSKWQLKDYYSQQNTLVFTKENKFFYVAVVATGENQPCDIYLVDSPDDLEICKILKDYFLQEEIAQDAPGKDFSDIPRYPGSKRRLNIFAPFQGTLLMYEADAKVNEIAKFYRQMLVATGWKAEQAFNQDVIEKLAPQTKGNLATLLFYRDEDTLLVYIVTLSAGVGSAEKISQRSLIIMAKNIEQELTYPEEGGEE